MKKALWVAGVSLCLNVAAFAQSVSLDLIMVPVKEAMGEIRDKCGYSFVYSAGDLDTDRLVTVRAYRLDEAIAQVLEGQAVTYEIKGKNIIVKKAAAETKELKKTRRISGVIRDAQGYPVIGANVLAMGDEPYGVITDFDGRFTLDVPEGARVEVSYIGYLTQTFSVRGKSDFVVDLKEDNRVLDEVVVVAYGTQKKVNTTGAIAAVEAADLEDIPVSNLSNTLAGRAPGVTVTGNSGFAGASSSIRVRGSFAEPLYVINGVIRDKTSFDSLDPNEVESINILKDAASASVYGSKAGNGVVLVTTRKGTVQKPVFQYKASYTTARTTRPLQDWTACEELTFVNRAAAYKNSMMEHPDPDFKVPYGQNYFDYFAGNDGYCLNDIIWQTPWNTEHNISVSGGDRVLYYMMLGYHGEDGSYQDTRYNRYNFRSDITARITDRFKVNFNVSGNDRHFKRFYWPYDNNPESMTLSDFYRTTFYGSRLRPWYVDAEGRPSEERTAYPVSTGGAHFGELVLGDNYEKTNALNIEAILKLELDLDAFVPGLSTSVLGQYNMVEKNRKRFATFNKSYVFQSASADNVFISGPVDPDQVNIHNLGHSYENIQENVWMERSYQLNWMLNYDHFFGRHHVTGLVAFEVAEARSKFLTGTAEELLSSGIDQIFASSPDALRRYFDGRETDLGRVAWIGRFHYNYDNRYIAEFSFREDGNARFGPKHRWGFFPSVSFGWRISNEEFMQSVGWLSNLKLRGSYGTTGDDTDSSSSDGSLALFGWRDKYQNAGGYMFGDTYYNGISVGPAPNKYLTWATLKLADIGFDWGLFNNALVGEFSYFHKRKTDVLQQRVASLPDTYGREKAAENYAEQVWNGFDLSVRYSNRIGNVNYSVNANVGYAKDKWTRYDEPANLPGWKSRIGHPDGYLTGYVCEGIIRTQEQLDALPEGFTQFGRKPRLGQLLYRDIRGANEAPDPDGKVDSNDWDYLSRRAVPRVNYGVGLNAEWKGLSVDVLFQGVGGYDRYVRTLNGDGVFQIEDRPYFELWAGDVWTPENPDAKYPAATGEWSEDYGAAGSTFWIRNGAFLRLKNLKVAYTLPDRWCRGLGLNTVQVFGNGTNLFSLDGMDEMDPEQDRLDSYPIMRTFTVGLTVKF